MPRFYFHVRNHDGVEEDFEGGVFQDAAAAEHEAVLAAREMMAQKILSGETIDGDRFEVTTEEGQVVAIVPFRSVVKLD
jgi:hypothetical protein